MQLRDVDKVRINPVCLCLFCAFVAWYIDRSTKWSLTCGTPRALLYSSRWILRIQKRNRSFQHCKLTWVTWRSGYSGSRSYWWARWCGWWRWRENWAFVGCKLLPERRRTSILACRLYPRSPVSGHRRQNGLMLKQISNLKLSKW